MSQIYDPPNDYDFGLDFNYAVWAKDTRISLINVPWNNDYRDIVRFADKAALNEYLTSRENVGITLSNVSYVKPNEPIHIDVPFNSAYRFNYLRASAPVQPIAGDFQKDFYYFITNVRYIAPNTTEIVVQLDVWQTFGYDATFGNCYIERGHIGIANEKAFDNYGRDYLTIPEGLDVGGEYLQIAKRSQTLMQTETMDILVCSTVDLTADPGSISDPALNTARGSLVQGMPSGAEFYIFNNIDEFYAFMVAYSDKPWVTQGIISITAIPELFRYNYESEGVTSESGITFRKLRIGSSRSAKGRYYAMFEDWRSSSEILNNIPQRYRHLVKFLTYPYMVIEMTTWSGTPTILKPESWADPDAFLNEKASIAPPNQKIVIYPRRYNAKRTSVVESYQVAGDNPGVVTTEYTDDGGEYLDKLTQVSNFPSFAIVNNMAIAYMAANSNSIAFQNQSADWAQQRALAGNQNTYDQQSAGIEMSKNLAALQRSGMAATLGNDQAALTQSVAANGLAGVVGSTIGVGMGGLTGGVGGAAAGAGGVIGAVQGQIMGGVNAGISMEQGNRQLAVNQNLNRGSNALQNNQAGYMRDTNKSLNDWAARGDYENSIAGINAKIQDVQLTQPSTAGQVGGEAFNIIHKAMEISLRWKMISTAELRIVGEYWLRYGYAVRQFGRMPDSFMVMTKFTYWKLSETYITAANMPEYVKQALRGIFEKGVTVWANPADIGNIDVADNRPLEGISL